MFQSSYQKVKPRGKPEISNSQKLGLIRVTLLLYNNFKQAALENFIKSRYERLFLKIWAFVRKSVQNRLALKCFYVFF